MDMREVTSGLKSEAKTGSKGFQAELDYWTLKEVVERAPGLVERSRRMGTWNC